MCSVCRHRFDCDIPNGREQKHHNEKIKVDSVLNRSSDNAISNRAVCNAFDTLVFTEINEATQTANNAAENARYETANSVAQTNKCKETTENARIATNEAIAAADRANTAAENAEQSVEDVREAIASQSLGIPSSMTVEYPQHLTVGNREDSRIVATLYPLATALQNVLFLSDNNAVSVYPDGSIHINKAGRSVVHVVPTMNTALYRTLLITVSEPSVRLTKTNCVRLLAGGTFRLN